MTIAELSPGLTLIAGSLLIPLLRGRLRSAYLVLLPLLGLAHLALLSTGEFGTAQFLGQNLVLLRVDRWSMVFGWIFMIATLIAANANTTTACINLIRNPPIQARHRPSPQVS